MTDHDDDDDDDDFDIGAELFRRRDERKAAERAAHEHADATPTREASTGDVPRYLARALELELAALRAATEGERNDQLNKSAYNLAQLHHLGLDEHSTRDELRAVAISIGLEVGETARSIESGWSAGLLVPRAVELREAGTHASADAAHPFGRIEDSPSLASDVADFWHERRALQHLHDFARARRVSPWAVLGVALARVACRVPAHVVLPPLVGSHASLNLFVALVGQSGSGKGGAERVATEALLLGHVKTATTGSGEGIAHAYKKRDRKGAEDWLDSDHSVLFSVPEVDTLAAQAGRQASTLLPELRRAWSGEELGFAYVDQTRRLKVPLHEYRLCLVLGVQPQRARALLDDIDGGTPQRFTWLPATDRHAPADDLTPPAVMTWVAPDFGGHAVAHLRDAYSNPPGLIVMPVCDVARKLIDDAAKARLRGEVAALDGHALLTQLKVAAALSLLDGRLDVRDDDWQLSDVLARVSLATRNSVQEQLKARFQERNALRAENDAARAVIVGERVADAAEKAAGRRILAVLEARKSETAGRLKNAIRHDSRHAFDAAIEALVELGQVIETEEEGTVRYALAKKR